MLPLAVVVLDHRQRALLVNEAWVALTGMSGDASRDKGWLRAAVADDRQQLLAALSGGPAGQGHRLPRPAGSVDCRVRTRQGERWTRWSWLADPAPFAATTAVCITDVHEDRNREDTLRQDSWHDPLTGVLNRGRFVDLLEQALIPEVEGCVELGVLFADLDGFKAVNDLGGHALGDRVLHDAADRMTGRLRPQDVLGRVGGDEFAILCRGSRTDLLAVVSRMAAVFDQPFAALGHVVHVGLTVGMAMASPGDNAASLLERADHAMYVDKRSAPHTAPLPG